LELFEVEECHDVIEKGYSRSLEMTPFAYHAFLFVVHCSYGHILYRFGDKAIYLSVENRYFFIPLYATTPAVTVASIFTLCFHDPAISLEYRCWK